MNSIFSSLSLSFSFFSFSLLFYSKTEKKIITTLWGPSFFVGSTVAGKRGQPEAVGNLNLPALRQATISSICIITSYYKPTVVSKLSVLSSVPPSARARTPSCDDTDCCWCRSLWSLHHLRSRNCGLRTGRGRGSRPAVGTSAFKCSKAWSCAAKASAVNYSVDL